jgi:hypothetical protein
MRGDEEELDGPGQNPLHFAFQQLQHARMSKIPDQLLNAAFPSDP